MDRDFIEFLLILYLIYLSDCIVFARATEWILYAPLRGMKWRVKAADASPAVGGRFWLLRPLLVPLGSSMRLPFIRCALGHSGFCSASPLGRTARMGNDVRYMDYDGVESVEFSDNGFVVKGATWSKGTGHELEEARAAVEALIASSDRPTAVRGWIAASYKTAEKAQERIEDLESRTSILNLLCSVYALWLLLFLPVAFVLLPPVRLLWQVALPLLLLHLVCGGVFLRVHAKRLPAMRVARWETMFKMLLCPPMMLRACDHINDHAGVAGDPLGVLLACTEERIWRSPVRQAWRRLIPRSRSALAPEAAVAMNQYAEAYRSVLESALAAKGIAATALGLAIADIPRGQRVCPCCETVYRNDVERCIDCGDVPLLEGEGVDHVS